MNTHYSDKSKLSKKLSQWEGLYDEFIINRAMGKYSDYEKYNI